MSDELRRRAEKLSPAKRALLEKALRQKTARDQAIPRLEGDGPYALSSAQERFWFLEALEPGNPAHHIAGITDIEGVLDVDALESALRQIATRHETLRTRFVDEGGRPRQEVLEAARIDLLPRDWRNLAGDTLVAARAALRDEILVAGYDLALGPLWRFALVRTDDASWQLWVGVHHAVADGLSLLRLADELLAFYRATATGGAPGVPALPIQYRDYAAWQRDRAESPAAREALAWWCEALDGLPSLALPPDPTLGDDVTVGGMRHGRELSPALLAAVRRFAAERETTPFTVILSAFAALLHRLTGEEDFAIGVPVANRERPEVRDLIGFFVNSLTLRVPIDPEASFAETLAGVHERRIAAEEHQDVPFERIVDALQPERHPTRNPLFQVMFNYVDFADWSGEVDGLKLRYEVMPAGTLLDLTLYAYVGPERLRVEFEVDRTRHGATRCHAWLDQLQQLLEHALEAPETALAHLPLLDDAARRAVLDLGRGAALPALSEANLADALRRASRERPEALAVSDDEGSWTHQELMTEVDAFTAWLHSLGLGPGDRVGVALPRQRFLVAALLAIADRGAAWVPLDPDYPNERLAILIEDAAPRVILTTKALASRLPRSEGLCLVEERHAPGLRPPTTPRHAEAPAYVIHTSGSTGRPKGVVVPHRALLAFLHAMLEAPGFTSDDSLLAVTTLSFDIAGLELFAPLLAGGRVVLASRETARDGHALRRRLARGDVTVMQATPSTWRLLLHAGWEGTPGLRALSGGEPLPADLARTLRHRTQALWNLYGPTETTIWSTVEQVTGPEVLIGRPIRGTRVFVADAAGAPVPCGTRGELIIGGAGLALGYDARPEEEARAFLIGPDGERFYRTGDAAVMREDGRLEGHGRLDDQLKVRGHRVEPGEIEAALRDEPEVEDAAVRCVEDGDRLVAWITPSRQALESRGDEGVEDRELAVRWSTVWGATYDDGAALDPENDFRGWNDSSSGEPIPATAMLPWIASRAEWVASFAPRHVLEIGCGTGLFLWRLAPRVDTYWALDSAPGLIARLEAHRRERAWDHVRLFNAGAEELASLPERRFDTILLHSVAQYLPSLDALLRVLRLALARLEPGGRILLGDLRRKECLGAQYAAGAVRHAPAAASVRRVRDQVQRRLDDEPELAIDPELWPALAAAWPEIARARVRLQTDASGTEMSRYRYDVVLETPDGAPDAGPGSTSELRWGEDVRDPASLARRLETSDGRVVCHAVPDRDVGGALAAWQSLQQDATRLAALRAQLGTTGGVRRSEARGLDPKQRPFSALPDASKGATYTAVFGAGPLPASLELTATQSLETLRVTAATSPQRTRHRQALLQALRQRLAARLPSWMTPSEIVFLDALPRTPNGKLDRRALPDPAPRTGTADQVPPREGLETTVAEQFCALLGVEAVGRDDDFFALGGHSLLATQLVARLLDRTGRELPLRSVFAAPSVAGLARALVAGEDSPDRSDAVVPGARDPEGPATFAQERLWFLERLQPGRATYHLPVALRLRGPLSRAALRGALEDLRRRHGALRTTFRLAHEALLQVAADAALPPIFEEHTLSGSDAPEAAGRLAAEHATRPFDLEAGPLWRVHLYRLADEDHLLLFVWHHAIIDGWSLGLVAKDFAAFYAARLADTPAPAAAERITLRDVARHERGRQERGEDDADLAFWCAQLREAPTRPCLPTDRPRPAVQAHRGRRLRRALGTEPATRLRAFASFRRTTPFAVLQSAFATLLHRLSERDDLVIGTSWSQRTRPELQELVGFFVNSLPLRITLEDRPGFGALVDRVHEQVVEAAPRQHLPFERVVQALNLPRDLGHAPLFQVSLDLLNVPLPALSLPDLEVSVQEVEQAISKFDLSLLFRDDAALSCVVEFDTDLFDEATIDDWWTSFTVILAAGMEQTDIPVDRLPALSPEQFQRVIIEANRSEQPVPVDLGIHRRFEEVALRRAEAVAVSDGTTKLSYRALDQRANALAWRLRDEGVQPEEPVAIHLARGPEAVIAMIGILKAGAAVVALDPGQPRARRRQVFESAGARHVVMPAGEASLFDQGVTRLDPESLLPREVPPPDDAREDGLACIIYTSGSTGHPKGVEIPHRALANYVGWAAQHYPAGGGAPLFTALDVDLTLTSILVPLLRGETVRVLPAGHGVEPLRHSLVEDRDYAFVKLTPTHLDGLTLDELPDAAAWARALIIGGEALRGESLEAWRESAPDLRLFNEYGPTEATVACAVHEIAPGIPAPGAVPIGNPIANARLYVLDRHGAPVPPGALGELHVGGMGVARGYRALPELTAERFLPDAFAEGESARRYRTGDRVRRRGDGALVFHGRYDDQIKIRGVRIEPAEVEAALCALPEIAQACVLVDREGDLPRLHAYVVAEPALDLARLPERLTDSLPRAMIPARYARVEAMPLAPGGKIDRPALARLETAAARTADSASPESHAERVLARIWSELLDVPAPGLHDDFFSLGGDSILAIQLVSRARHRGLHLEVHQVFEQPRLGALAGAAREGHGAIVGQEPRRDPLPLTPIQSWLAAGGPTAWRHANQTLAFTLSPQVELAHLVTALDSLLRHHDAFGFRFDLPTRTQRFLQAPSAAEILETLSLPSDEAEAAARLGSEALRLPTLLDPATGPLTRGVFATREGAPSRFLWSIHHLVVDGVSWRVLAEDLEATLDAALTGREPALPERTSAFSAWIGATVKNEPAATRRVDDSLLGAPAATSVEARAATVTRRVVSGCDPRGLEAHARVRADDLLLAALARALRDDVQDEAPLRVAVEHHGRDTSEPGFDLGRTVGWFTTMASRVLSLPRDAEPLEDLRTVRSATSEDAPFGEAPVLFNHHGRITRTGGTQVLEVDLDLPRFVPESAPRRHALELETRIEGDRLVATWTWSAPWFDEAGLDALHRHFEAALQRLTTALSHAGASILGAFDVSLAGVTDAEVLRLAHEIPALEDLYPLTPTQQGMFFHALYAPGTTAYFEQLASRLRGPLNRDRLRRAFEDVLTGHEPFRSAVCWRGLEQPLWAVRTHAPLPWSEEDWGDLDEATWRPRFEAWLEEDRGRGFSLDEAPLFRIHCVQLTGEDQLLVLSYHHLVMDGWSMPRLVGQVLRRYRALEAATPPPLSLAPPFRDHLAWLATQDLSSARDFWKQELGDVTEATPLVRGRRLPDRATGHEDYGEIETTLGPLLSRALETLARRSGLTQSTLVLGAWAALLSRMSGQDDVVFGATVSGRSGDLEAIEERIGLFINTLPVRVRLSDSGDFGSWLRTLQAEHAERLRHESTPLVLSQAQSAVPAKAPLFHSLVVFENYPLDTALLEAEAPFSLVETWSFERTSYPLTLVAIPGERLTLRLLHDRALFPDAEARAWLERLTRVFEGFVDDAVRTPVRLPVLPAAEREHLLHAASGRGESPRRAPLPFKTVYALTDLNPDAPAIVAGETTWSYGELTQRADALASRLLEAVPGSFVGLALRRRPDLIAAQLACWRAGKAFVPLDPDEPAARRQAMIEDAGVAAILISASDRAQLEGTGAALLVIEDVAPMTDAFTPALPDADEAAYVIFTSGSTGRPKGVLVEHGSFASFLAAARAAYELSADDRILQFASPLFDASLEEIWGALSAGATLVLRDDDFLVPAPAFFQRLSDLSVTVADLPTAWWHEMMAQLADAEIAIPPSLRLVILGGEAARTGALQTWRRHFDPEEVRLINSYGPTEATVVATVSDLSGGPEDPLPDPPPIGRPLPGVEAFLLDDSLRLTPQGVAGELCLGGRQVARGYVNDEAATAARFITLALSEGDAPRRLYRTGDLARFRDDGELEYLGRLDDQLKIGGFRVEPAEVEQALLTHPQVTEARVLAAPAEDGTLAIDAWIVPDRNAPDLVDTLRAHCAATLPPPLRPRTLSLLETLPLNRQGKLDRDRLPRTLRATVAQSTARTPDEAALTRLFAEILEQPAVSVHDDFFLLGGNSLAAVRLMSQLASDFGVDLPLRDLFEGPTPAELAVTLAHLQRGQDLETLRARRAPDLEARATLPADLQVPQGATEPETLERLTLTGATGFLGAFVLDRLLQTTDLHLTCLVRAADADAGLARIKKVLVGYELDTSGLDDRVRVLPAHLDRPRLGLDADAFEQLSEDSDALLHLAAATSFLAPYSRLEAANVGGTLEMIRLAGLRGLRLHHVSTVGVFDVPGLEGEVTLSEDADLRAFASVQGGYAQTKWVAERLVQKARDRGLPVTLYRPGRITAHSKTGLLNPDDFATRLLRACLELGCAPDLKTSLDLTPVDYAAHALVALLLKGEDGPYHLTNPTPLPYATFITHLATLGHSLTLVPQNEFNRRLRERLAPHPQHPLYPLLAFLTEDSPANLTQDETPNAQFSTTRTRAHLEGTGITCPSPDTALLAPALRRLT